MTAMILTFNLIFSTLLFGMIAKYYLWPRLEQLAPASVLVPILLLHGFRHLGLMFLAPGAVYTGMPEIFALPAALGDLVAALLAVAAIPALTTGASFAKPLVWVFNVEGTLDLLAAIALATVSDAGRYMGPAYWIPAFWVPALLVTHWITFVVLRRPWPLPTPARDVSQPAERAVGSPVSGISK
jgi:hypothetical protein